MKLNALKPYFPHAFKANSVKALIIGLLVYAVIVLVVDVVQFFLGWIPIVGWLLGIIAWLINIYAVVGVILAILVYLKVVQ